MHTINPFIWLQSGVPLFSQSIRTLFSNTESYVQVQLSARAVPACKHYQRNSLRLHFYRPIYKIESLTQIGTHLLFSISKQQ